MQNFHYRFMKKIGYVIAVKFMGDLIKWIFYFTLYERNIQHWDAEQKCRG